LLRLQALKARTFFIATVSGGSLSAAAISATPFLLPLMLQVGFGMSPIESGSMLLIYMAANLGMKVFTNRILRQFGIRRVLVVNGAISSAAIAGCALVSPHSPLPANALLLVLAGGSRSMQFTSNTFITFADLPPAERSSANSLSALVREMSTGIGVAVAALLLNFSRSLRHSPDLHLNDFRIAFVVTGALGALSIFAYARLAHDAGAEITGHRIADGERPAGSQT
jgi:MFS family permease